MSKSLRICQGIVLSMIAITIAFMCVCGITIREARANDGVELMVSGSYLLWNDSPFIQIEDFYSYSRLLNGFTVDAQVVYRWNWFALGGDITFDITESGASRWPDCHNFQRVSTAIKALATAKFIWSTERIDLWGEIGLGVTNIIGPYRSDDDIDEEQPDEYTILGLLRIRAGITINITDGFGLGVNVAASHVLLASGQVEAGVHTVFRF